MRKTAVKLLALSLLVLFSAGLVVPMALARPSQLPDEGPYLNNHRFGEQAWSTTVNWVDIAKAAIEQLNDSGMIPGDVNLFGDNFDPALLDMAQVNTYHVYVNQYNYWMFYSGFENFTFPNPDNISQTVTGTLPMQTILQSYKTTNGLTVFSLSTFAFTATYNETNGNGEVDEGEEIYVLLGFNLGLGDFTGIIPNDTIRDVFTDLFSEPPSVTTYPITAVDNGYTWGMRYDNLKMLIFKHDKTNPTESDNLLGLIVIDGLEFNYTLAFDTALNRVIINQEYKIGLPTKLIIPEPSPSLHGQFIINNTAPDYNLSKFLEEQNLSFSIVNFQTTTVINTSAQPIVTTDPTGSTITNNSEVNVTKGNITDKVGDDVIFSVDFSEKPTYKLNNPDGTLNGTYLVQTHIYNADGVRGLLDNPFILFPMIFINMPSAAAILWKSDRIIEGASNILGVVLPYIPNGTGVWKKKK
ncbi:MAG: hypothetical protein ACTSQY_09925, partial [Candidatus Odinarchaeia archaeon]